MEAGKAGKREERWTVTVRLARNDLNFYTQVMNELNLKIYEMVKLAVILLLKIAALIKSGGTVILLDANGKMEKLCILELEGLQKEKHEGGE
jgi:hypothetical protein